MLTKLGNIIDGPSENLNKELENIKKKNESELKNTITERKKKMLRGINSRQGDTEGISDLEDKIMEITQSEQQKDK